MQFGEKVIIKKIGEEIGFFIGSIFFFSVLYIILRLLNRISAAAKYWHIFIPVIVIYILRLLFKLKK